MLEEKQRKSIASAVCRLRGKDPKQDAIIRDERGNIRVVELWQKVDVEIRPVLEVLTALVQADFTEETEETN